VHFSKFTSLQVHKITKHKITKLQIEKLQDYKLHVLVCKFQIYKIIHFSVYNIEQYQNYKYMFANMKNYKIIKITNLQFDKLQVHVLKFTSLQITKSQDYKLHVLVCKFQIYKLKNFSIYKIKYIKIENALLHIYKFAHDRFSCFHTCMYYKITKSPVTKYKTTKLQIAKL